MEELITRKDLREWIDREYLRGKCTIKEMTEAIPAADAVPWSFLEQLSEGRRCNYASDFISEAKEVWQCVNEK